MRTTFFALLFLAACDAPTAPRDASTVDDAGVIDASPLPVDGPAPDAPEEPFDCDDGPILVHAGPRATVLSLSSNADRWVVTYEVRDEVGVPTTYLRVFDVNGLSLWPTRVAADGTRVTRFGEGFLALPATPESAIAFLDLGGDPVGTLSLAALPPDARVTQLETVEGTEPTAMFVTTEASGRAVYVVTAREVRRVLELPAAEHALVGLRADAILDVRTEDVWDGEARARMHPLGAGAGEPFDIPAWTDGPQWLADIQFQDGLWYVLGGRRDPESRFYRGRIVAIVRDHFPMSDYAFGEPGSLSPLDGGYYGVAGALTDGPAFVRGVLLEGGLGTQSYGRELSRFEHQLFLGGRGGPPYRDVRVLAWNTVAQRFGTVGNVTDALVMRCDLQADGTHGSFAPTDF